MGRYLIVANQTLGAEGLDREVRERIERGERGEARFFVLVPRIAPQREAVAWSFGYSAAADQEAAAAGSAFQRDTRQREARFEARFEARRRAERRLDQMVDAIRAAGGKATGRVGEEDVTAAVRTLLEERSFDEIIISTLPTGISRWLKTGVPRQVARMTDIPVITVEAKG